ncbi:hypothetical protein J6590_071554 [Homalodisca vitripennis]|nr:hypothetical protein J6590_071554 [Homalodisca vitripennis]
MSLPTRKVYLVIKINSNICVGWVDGGVYRAGNSSPAASPPTASRLVAVATVPPPPPPPPTHLHTMMANCLLTYLVALVSCVLSADHLPLNGKAGIQGGILTVIYNCITYNEEQNTDEYWGDMTLSGACRCQLLGYGMVERSVLTIID